MTILELNTKWGPKQLREIVLKIQNGINDRCPKPGVGIDIDENADGCVISTQAAQGSGGSGDDGGSSGASAALYGALNGAPAVFHLLQSSPPTPVP